MTSVQKLRRLDMNPTEIKVNCTINFVPFDEYYTLNYDLVIQHKAFRFMVLHSNQTQLPVGRVLIAEYDYPHGDIVGPNSYQREIVYDSNKKDSITHYFPSEEYRFKTLEWITTQHARMVWEGLVKNHQFRTVKMHPSSVWYDSPLLVDLVQGIAERLELTA